MSQSYQQIERRKENIISIEPLVSAMRTISLSQWRMALNRQNELNSFRDEVEKANHLLRHNYCDGYAQIDRRDKILIILGSNRGLCGNFNKRLIQYFENEAFAENRFSQVFLIGIQLFPLFNKFTAWNLLTLDFPDIQNIKSIAQSLSLEKPELVSEKHITIIFNKYKGASRYKTTSEQIYPINEENALESNETHQNIILDTDPRSMAKMLDFLTFNTHLQTCLYSSMASEHSSRFAMMENADSNVKDLINELDILLQDYRKGKVTTETQELAVASGLLTR